MPNLSQIKGQKRYINKEVKKQKDIGCVLYLSRFILAMACTCQLHALLAKQLCFDK